MTNHLHAKHDERGVRTAASRTDLQHSPRIGRMPQQRLTRRGIQTDEMARSPLFHRECRTFTSPLQAAYIPIVLPYLSTACTCSVSPPSPVSCHMTVWTAFKHRTLLLDAARKSKGARSPSNSRNRFASVVAPSWYRRLQRASCRTKKEQTKGSTTGSAILNR